MKKMVLIMAVLLGLTGCGGGSLTKTDGSKSAVPTPAVKKAKVLTPKEAGAALVDGMIFQKEQELVRTHFKDAESLLDDPDSGDTADLAALLVKGMKIEAPDLTDADAAMIANNLKNEMDQKASYEITEVTEGKNNTYEVTYQIKGVNYLLALEKGTRMTLDKIKADPTLATDESQIQTMIYQGFGESLAGIGTIEAPVMTKMTLTSVGDKWALDATQSAKLQQLVFCCMLGVTSENDLQMQVVAMTQRVMVEYQ